MPITRGRLAIAARVRSKTAAVTQTVSVSVPADHRQQHVVGLQFVRVDRIRDAERSVGELHARMPFAKNQRRFRRDHDRHRGLGASSPQRGGEVPHVVFVLVRPTEREDAVHQIRERAFNMNVDPRPHPGECFFRQGASFAQQPRSLILAPGGKFRGYL